ncbi:lytic transglycosylase domain-containing protein [Heliophilum fasciatum]|uniref:Soluble lytic murein transglycosylase n=1 Tax=Heliophilum fasciatum TaxID=35700 RepID=A0A4R2S900_9FIRM|nr:lytic transglycosylase domain-containing protein [Heliophilum fasciatum]MCW2276728.1 soluble lytic murein transglycosylase [Heliophilum fasciatum]TCP68891.1 soluble lytic murein transglycosylase [Heliophilum fasciatum]
MKWVAWGVSWLRVFAVALALAVLGNIVWYSSAVQKIIYPIAHRQEIMKYAAEYQLDPYLVTAIIRRESKFWSWAESDRGAKGLMQIMPQTGAWIAEQMPLPGYTPDQLYEPEVNIRMGCWYLASLQREFHGNQALMIAAYNGGRGNVRQWLTEHRWSGREQTLDMIPFPETRIYVRNVLYDYGMYHRLYD